MQSDLYSFLMTYPCFIALRNGKFVVLTTTDGKKCICLFTDEDNARDSLKNEANAQIAKILDAGSLLDGLKRSQETLEQSGILFVAIDPYKNKTLFFHIATFIQKIQDDIEKEDAH